MDTTGGGMKKSAILREFKQYWLRGDRPAFKAG